MKPCVEAFHDPQTSTITYVVYEDVGSPCAIIDSVLDYEPHAGRIATHSADRVVRFVAERNLQVQWLLETHAHADHVSAAAYLRGKLGGAIGIGECIGSVQAVFERIFDLDSSARTEAGFFDHLFADGEAFQVGALTGRVMHVPGHTPADVAYVFDGLAFMGDTLFMPDVGTARCDFPGGDAGTLYESIGRLLSLPSQTRLFACHDYPPDGREARWETTVAEQRAANIHVRDGITVDAFVAMRNARDATLGQPALIIPSIQLNIHAGVLPPAGENGVRYLKLPLNTF
ncbi:MBL fold metallo-hydrolase [Paraburkholderia flava]|uniref:MBL fold metallo-hydrolase n=1 Tax=Paraburkholderia flava TaxID=2547393 RepID=UPI00105D301A|nr:MBL fold metallo-hydrolase [Paraburkholderia flava]